MERVTEQKSVSGGATLAWLVRFWGLAAFFYWFDRTAVFKAVVVAPYARFSTSATAHLLTLLGVEVKMQGTSLTVLGKGFVVADSCTGSFVFLLLAAVILTFPATWREKLVGLAAGLVTVISLNLLRTLMIVLLGARFPGSFWSLHIIVGQALIIAGTLGVFVWWAQIVGTGRPVFSLSFRRQVILVLLYLFGFLFSYGIYTLFLNSPVGTWFKDLVIRHAAIVLGLFTETVQQGQVINTARNSIRVIHDCLSSPVLVLFLAAFFIIPISWPQRLLLYALCFFPSYYLYHLFRTVVAVAFLAGGRQANFAYNFFGQIALVKALLLFSVYYWACLCNLVSLRFQLSKLFIAGLPALGLGLFSGYLWKDFGLPLLALLAGSGAEFYDPGRIVSLMLVFHSVAWILLILTTPLWSLKRRLAWALTGYLLFNLFFAFMVCAFLIFGLAPHPWLIKFINVGLPFVVYFMVVKWKFSGGKLP